MKNKNDNIILFMSLSIVVCMLLTSNILYAAAVDSDSIEVAYPLDEKDGNVAKDISGNGRHGEIIGAKRVEGMYGNALDYDGVDDNLIVTGYNGIGGTDPRTTVFWFKSVVIRDHSWVKWGPNVNSQKYYIRAHPRGNECNLRVEINGGNNFGTDNVCDGQWHHCAVVFPEGGNDVQDHDLYVDGKLQVKEGTEFVMNTNIDTQAVNIGARLVHHTFMHGSMDEVAIFNVDLSLEQINAIRNEGLQSALGIDPKDKLATRWGTIKRY